MRKLILLAGGCARAKIRAALRRTLDRLSHFLTRQRPATFTSSRHDRQYF